MARTAKKKSAPKPGEKVLLLRTCTAEMRGTQDKSRHFVWPRSGPVEAPDWNPEPICGFGLHGLLWGEGDWSLLRDEPDSVWVVFEADESEIVSVQDGTKFKAPRGNVIYAGNKAMAMTLVLCSKQAFQRTYEAAEAADRHSSTAASSGDSSTAASSGNSSKAASSGDSSKAASSGDYSKAASSGDYSTAEQIGKSGIAATIGHGGTVSAGELGAIVASWWSKDEKRYRVCVGYVGEDGIEAGVAYVVKDGKLAKK